MKRLLLSLAFLILQIPSLQAAQKAKADPRYAVAVSATPVLNTPDFRKTFSGDIKLDPCQGVRPIEFMALPGTPFTIEDEQIHGGVTVYRVTSSDYPYPTKTGYFVDARFLRVVAAPAPERPRALPGLAEVQQGLMAALGRPYVWGGNFRDGVPLLGELYPAAATLAGVDCSGLLYQATDGYTPRNSSALTAFGTGVPIAGLPSDAIAQRLLPLDLIVWKGHVMVVLDEDTVIESTMGCRGGGGVGLTPLKQALRQVMRSRKPVDGYPQGSGAESAFVVRRWFPR